MIGKSRLPSLTIGIPAHNEEKSISKLLVSILKQKQTACRIDAITIVLDGCTDNTKKIVELFQTKVGLINIWDDNKRTGKAERLNQILRKATTDYVLLCDADVVFKTDQELKYLFEPFKDAKVQLVGARFEAAPQKNFWGRCSVVSFSAFFDAATQWNNGANFFTMIGAVQLMRQSFAKQLRFPKGIVSDQSYVYMFSQTLGDRTYALAQKSSVQLKTVASFADWRLLASRSIEKNKNDAYQFFPNVKINMTLPRVLYVKELLKWVIKDPLAVVGSSLMNVFIRIFPLKVGMDTGVWETTQSSR